MDQVWVGQRMLLVSPHGGQGMVLPEMSPGLSFTLPAVMGSTKLWGMFFQV